MGKQASPEAKAAGATIYSVAEHAGVSIATVSRVLQGATVVAESTRQKVLTAVEELGYVPLGAARSLAVRHHEAHGLVLPELTGPYYAELLMGFEARAAELAQSIVLVLTDSRTDLAAAVKQLATRVDAIAVFGSSAEVVQLVKGRKPVVVIAGDPQDGVEAISAENRESA
ncbi:LacI family DNA-binding transcriptional regulator, partial [Lentzea sp.]|uniref:LacI family DNA-binding transcriptional regulator n=1 Tax=Lentzea sp. TaxID=56099 RepID=UPI002ED5F850